MKETPIIDFGDRARLGKPDHSVMQRLEELFATAPHITREQIRLVAYDMARELEEKLQKYKYDPEGQVKVLFQGLDLWTTMHPRSFDADGSMVLPEIGKSKVSLTYLFCEPPDGVNPDNYGMDDNAIVQIPRKEVERALLIIRKALLDDLHGLLDPIVIHVAEEALRWNRVFSSASGEIIKKTKNSGLIFPEVYAIPITRALRKLYDDPQELRSPHIAYTLQNRDTRTGIEIHEQIDIKNMGELTEAESHEVTFDDFHQYVSFFLDNLKGAQFLVSKGLGLGDINLYNMGVDGKNLKGKLFDFDYLVPSNINILNKFYGHLGRDRENFNYDYKPPWRANMEGRGPISEFEMLYQFGITLEHLLYRMSNKLTHNNFLLMLWPKEEQNFFYTLKKVAETMREEAVDALSSKDNVCAYSMSQAIHELEIIIEAVKH